MRSKNTSNKRIASRTDSILQVEIEVLECAGRNLASVRDCADGRRDTEGQDGRVAIGTAHSDLRTHLTGGYIPKLRAPRQTDG